MPEQCSHCGLAEVGGFVGHPERAPYLHIKELVALKLCFYCWCWHRNAVYDDQNPGAAHVIDGSHYAAGIIGGPHGGGGFGGRVFVMEEIATGAISCVNNLWHQGEVPPSWRDRFPDTHRFVDGWTWVDVGGGEKAMGRHADTE